MNDLAALAAFKALRLKIASRTAEARETMPPEFPGLQAFIFDWPEFTKHEPVGALALIAKMDTDIAAYRDINQFLGAQADRQRELKSTAATA